MRIALLADLAPRKLGSFERWMLAFVAECQNRGHVVDVFARQPVHRHIQEQFDTRTIAFRTVDELEKGPIAAVRVLNRYDVLHLNLFAPRSRIAILSYLAWPARVLFVDRYSGPADFQGQRRILSRALDYFTMTRVAGLACISNFVRSRDLARFQLPASKTRTIYNGVDLQCFQPADLIGERDVCRIITAANLIPEKGTDVLIRAFARLRKTSCELVIVGDGPLRKELEALAINLAVADRVHFLGLRDDVAALLRHATVFVHPCTWAEAFGLTVAEAMASGLPTIASDIGAIPEIIRNGHDGLLVPPGNDERLAEALESVLSDSGLRERLAENARRTIVERFGVERCAAEHASLCEEVAA